MTSLAQRRWCHWTATVLLLTLGAAAEARGDAVVYATADNGVTFLFGTMDLTTDQFTRIATVTPLFGSLTAGPGGTLYGGAGNLNLNLYTISPSGATSQFGTVTAPSNSYGFLGLVSVGAAGFFADSEPVTNSGPITITLDRISADGNSSSAVGTMGTSFGSFNSGNLAFGPDGRLYFNAWTTSDVTTLYVVNTTTGFATAIGSGLGSADPLALISNGTTLYGIDTFAPTNPAIYTIDTTTGVATAIGTVSGLPTGYTLDTMAGTVPEPGTITLLGIGTLVLLAFSRHVNITK
jgi:PEP-CTERM motif